ERDEYGGDGLPRRARRSDGEGRPAPLQPSLFGWSATAVSNPSQQAAAAEVLAEIAARDPDQLTPIDALALLARWRQRLARD
ncbi:MAG TPA: hypothetical protein VD788_16830, partial [Candidatus Polarisedimenticolaceae bacterium]|nr:hypothetical protein [Candidatus Polarisedimenticolaceae bacterium]